MDSSMSTLTAETMNAHVSASASNKSPSPLPAPPAPAPAPRSSPINPNAPITLQVGERCFTILKETLTKGSQYFKARFSSNWTPDVQPDGSYFLDADGDTFAHILRYLRSKVYPLLFNVSKGFDVATYISIQQLADFLIIPALVDWIRDKRYLTAIKLVRTGLTREDVDDKLPVTTTTADTKTTYYPTWSTREVYLCPRGIFIHRGDKSRCGKDCAKALGNRSDTYEDEKYVERALEIAERVEFRREACLEAEEEEEEEEEEAEGP